MSGTQLSPLSSRATLQTVCIATLSTQHLQAYNAPQVHCLLNSTIPDALEELLQQVGLSSDNLLATPEVTPQDSNANRLLPCRPPPQPWKPFQPIEPKRNKRGRPNAPRQENGRFKNKCSSSTEKTFTAMPTISTTNEINPTFQMTFHFSLYDKLPPYENVLPVTTTASPYLNVPPVIISSSSCTYSNSDTLIPTPSTYVFPLFDQIAFDIISFLIQASPKSSSNSVQLNVLENMLHIQ